MIDWSSAGVIAPADDQSTRRRYPQAVRPRPLSTTSWPGRRPAAQQRRHSPDGPRHGLVHHGAAQSGVVARRQLSSAGCTPEQIRARLASGRWRAARPGVYVTFTGPLPPHARLWVAVLAAGPGAVAGPRSSLWLAGGEQTPPAQMDVVIRLDRRVRIAGRALPGVRRRGNLDRDTSTGKSPPRLRVEEAVLDRLGDLRRPAEVIDLVLRAVQQGFTTADRWPEGWTDGGRTGGAGWSRSCWQRYAKACAARWNGAGCGTWSGRTDCRRAG